MFSGGRGLSKGVKDGRALDDHRGFLVARKVSDRRLVDAAARVNVHGVYDFVCRLGILVALMLCLVLSGRRQQQAPVWRKGQAPEE